MCGRFWSKSSSGHSSPFNSFLTGALGDVHAKSEDDSDETSDSGERDYTFMAPTRTLAQGRHGWFGVRKVPSPEDAPVMYVSRSVQSDRHAHMGVYATLRLRCWPMKRGVLGAGEVLWLVLQGWSGLRGRFAHGWRCGGGWHVERKVHASCQQEGSK